VSSYRRSFFDPAAGGRPVALSSVRAGNVIGGGDWGADRLLPDCMRALTRGQTLVIRNPNAVRPWQHVLDPLNGYLMLAARTWDAPELAGGWNFGPALGEVQPVRWVADQIIERWGGGAKWELDRNHNPHEAGTLRLDSTKASVELGWKPRLQIRESLNWVVDWFRLQAGGEPAERATVAQIQRFLAL
jgi:CDP-glucose 4,6-dehydratase